VRLGRLHLRLHVVEEVWRSAALGRVLGLSGFETLLGLGVHLEELIVDLGELRRNGRRLGGLVCLPCGCGSLALGV
jgi:hypothetical protein